MQGDSATSWLGAVAQTSAHEKSCYALQRIMPTKSLSAQEPCPPWVPWPAYGMELVPVRPPVES